MKFDFLIVKTIPKMFAVQNLFTVLYLKDKLTFGKCIELGKVFLHDFK